MVQSAPIRLLVVDDHEMVRSGLAVFLETCDDITMVGEASSGEEALRKCTELQPDVLIMDLVMPGVNGIEATKAIRERFPHIQIIALTSFKEENLVHAALQAGAISYLLKNISIDELASAIRNAYLGKSTLAPEATQVLIESVTRPATPGHDLTERELEVMALMVRGFSNRKIADHLTISASTVKNHVSSILAKLSVSSRSEAVGLAVQHGLVDM
jgi:NarL family two-component system response regulator LiaR